MQKVKKKMKIEIKPQTINPFGGVNFILDELRSSEVIDLIDEFLGGRVAQAKYSYSDIIVALWCIFFCGGECAEDINENLKDYFRSIPDFAVPNADTVLRILKTLKTENETVVSSSNKKYTINVNEKLNELNIKIMIKLELLKPGGVYDYDFDNEVLGTEKFDSKRSYKQKNGYFPGMATLNGMPVYFENRDGNMNVKTSQAELLERSYKLLESFGLKINRSRMDCGSYTKDVIEMVEKYSKLFYIRAMRCSSLTDILKEIDTWETIEINYKIYQVASIEYKPFGEDKTYRLVITREKTDNKQGDLFTGDTMKYRGILTNDRMSSIRDVVEYYNLRGGEERVIDDLNNGFGWSKMPFSFMNENTVFLTLQMICKNIYTHLIRKFSKFFETLESNFRIKKFIFRFVIVPSKWISHSGQQILKLFTKRPYEKLILS